MNNLNQMDFIIIAFYLSVLISHFSAGIFLLLKSRNKGENVKNYLRGIAIFFLLYGLAKSIVFLFELTFPVNFVWNIGEKDFNKIFSENPDLSLRHDIVWRFTATLGVAGVAFLMYQLEKQILEKKTKFIFTIITIITVIPAILFGVKGKDEIDIVRIILYAGNIMLIVIPLIYLYLAGKTSGATRLRALGAMSGILILFLGIVFNSSIGKSLFENLYGISGIHITYILFGICVAIGTIIYLKSIQY
ncbi:MAG: hypothetical protein ACTSQS_09085 [Promethearchaeota archaeon]